MLAAGGHAGAVQAFDQRAGQGDDRGRFGVERAVADDAAASPVEIEHRGKRQIDAAGAQFGGEDMTDATRGDVSAASGSRSHSSPRRRIAGRRVNPVRQRCTLPPSWSMAIGKGGERSACTAAVNSASCCGDS
jgi:hypothetical protein